jgi:hypothetical protein
MLDATVVKFGNWLTRRRGVRVRPENLLLLFPHCLQWSDCPQNVTQKLANCRRCGKCRIKDLLELAERRGLQVYCASGGREAAARVKRPDVHAVLAVACEKELRQGMMATLPKPVLGVVNLRPHGPCRDTDVGLPAVEAALRELLAPPVDDA